MLRNSTVNFVIGLIILTFPVSQYDWSMFRL